MSRKSFIKTLLAALPALCLIARKDSQMEKFKRECLARYAIEMPGVEWEFFEITGDPNKIGYFVSK